MVAQAESGEISWNDERLDEWGKKATDYATAYHDATESVMQSQKNLADANAGLTKYEDLYTNQTNYVDFLTNLDTLAKEAGIKAKKIPESVSLGIQQGIYSVPSTGDELKNLIKLDGIVQEAQAAGVQVPASVAQGIQSGKYALPASVNQMKALIQLDDLQNQTFVSGVKVPEDMAKGIASGKTKPAAAVRQMNNLVKFDDLVKNSGISGTSAVKSLVASVNAGKTKPKEAIEQMLELMGDATDKSAKKSGEKSGKQVTDATAESIDKNKGKVKESSQEAVDDAAEVDYSGFRTLGYNKTVLSYLMQFGKLSVTQKTRQMLRRIPIRRPECSAMKSVSSSQWAWQKVLPTIQMSWKMRPEAWQGPALKRQQMSCRSDPRQRCTKTPSGKIFLPALPRVSRKRRASSMRK